MFCQTAKRTELRSECHSVQFRDDWQFQAARNRGARAIQAATITSLQALAQAAVGVVHQSIQDGDHKTAINVLKGLGLLSGREIDWGPTDPELLREESEVRAREKKSDLKIRGLGIF